MKEGLIKDTYETALKEIQTITTVSYILAVGIGMLFTFQKYSEFGINIFDFADVFDFLIAPFSDFKIFIFIIISVTFTYLLFRLDFFWRSKFPKSYSKMAFGWDKKEWYNTFRYLSFGLLFVFYLYISADTYGEVSKAEILNQPPIEIRFTDNEIKKGKIIGKTKEVIFLIRGEEVEAIPITSVVKEFEIRK